MLLDLVRIRRWFTLFAAATLLIPLAGCATHQAPEAPAQALVEATPVAVAAQAVFVEPAGTEPDDSNVEYWIAEEDPEVVEVIIDENTGVEDPVTDSPLDQLATETPELTADELAREAARIADAVPTFDIPIPTNDKVLAWVDVYSGRMKRDFAILLGRSGRYIDMFREIFAEAGVPQDLVYMAAVESGYKTTAYSRARAKGIFQFMSFTGRTYGLRVDYWVDERSDPEKSARAAAAYMKKLYNDFGDWHLAMAAYNAGEGKVSRALKRSGHKDFWGIARTSHIRRETKNHVPAILAATLISKDPQKYGFGPIDYAEPLRYDSIVVDEAVDLRVLARCAGTDLETMRELNPALRRYQTPADGPVDVRVPEGRAAQTLAALADVPESERILYARYKVRGGDSLSTIAAKHGVTVNDIQGANRMGRRTLIRAGQILRVPTSVAHRYADLDDGYATPRPDDGKQLVYRVRRGDTLYDIGRRYRTTANTIAAINSIPVNGVLSIGQRLKVVPGVTSVAAARSASGVRTASSSPAVASSNNGQQADSVLHTVRRGDTLWRIAQRYSTSVDDLCSMNRIRPSTLIHPGTKLTVGYK